MNHIMKAAIIDFVARTPDWVRRDLASKDAAERSRAEDPLAAMIVNAVEQSEANRSVGSMITSRAEK
jgi:hypothetical protein